jgi:hypothetical protein
MEILTYKLNSERNCAGISPLAKHTTPGIVGRFFEFFLLTEEERFRAGIYVGIEGREWIEQSAIILPDHLLMIGPHTKQE